MGSDQPAIPSAVPARGLAVLACMDSRLSVRELLGIEIGDAHVIRNAGGLATDDAIRSLVISQRLLHTREVVVIEHTRCGLLGLDEDGMRARLEAESGASVELPMHGFADLETNLREQVERIRSHPWMHGDTVVRGLIFDVESGELREVVPA